MVQYPHSSNCCSQTVGCADAFQRRECSGTQREKNIWYRLDLCAVNTIVCCTECRGVLWCERLPSAAELSLKGFPISTGLCVISGERWKCRYYLKVISLTLIADLKIVLVRRRSGVMTFTSTTVQRQHAEMLRMNLVCVMCERTVSLAAMQNWHI